MSEGLSALANFFKPVSGEKDKLLGIRIGHGNIQICDASWRNNAIELHAMASTTLPEIVSFANIADHQEIVAETIRDLMAAANLKTTDAAIILPSELVKLTSIDLPYFTDAELRRESTDPDFWQEYLPELKDFDAHVFNYAILESSENDDRTSIVVGYCDQELINQWTELALAAYLYPVIIEIEAISLVNMLRLTQSYQDRRKSFGILNISGNSAEFIGTSNRRIANISLEMNEFDLVLLDEADADTDFSGDFWLEVGERLSLSLKQAIENLQESSGFPAFSHIFLVTDGNKAETYRQLLTDNFKISPLSDWEPVKEQSFANMQETVMKGKVHFPSSIAIISAAVQRLGVFGAQQKDEMVCKLNLMPQFEKLKLNRQFGILNRVTTALLVAVVLGMGTWSGLITVPNFLEAAKAANKATVLKNDLDTIQRQVVAVSAKSNQLQQEITKRKSQLNNSVNSSALSQLVREVPADIELDNLYVQNADNIFMNGLSLSSASVIAFAQKLVTSDLITSPQVDIEGTADPVSFQIIAQLNKKDI